MADLNSTLTAASKYSSEIFGMDSNQLFLNIALAIAILIIGIFLGKIVNFLLRKLFQQFELKKKIRSSFISLFLVVVRWSIYLVFLSLAINRLGIPALAHLLTTVLITIPAFVAALVLISIGFAIAVYLRDVVEDAEVTGWDLISRILFYFVLFVFGVYALRVALIAFDPLTTNAIIVVLTAVIASAMAYIIAKKETRKASQ